MAVKTVNGLALASIKTINGLPLGGTLLTSDTFDRSDGALGSTDGSGSLDSVAWTVHDTDIQIISNEVGQVDTVNHTGATIDMGVSDGRLEVEIASPATASQLQGLMFRRQDASNWWAARPSTTNVGLVQVAGGVGPSAIASASPPVVAVAGDILAVEAEADEIRVYLNGTLLITHTSSTFETETRHGIYSHGLASTAKLDNFFAYTLSSVKTIDGVAV